MSETEARPGHVSRRAVTRVAAWSVPTVAVVAAAPAFAASPGTSYDVQVTADCGASLLDLSGNKRFAITALTGTVPAGTQFVLTGAGLLGLGLGGPATGLTVLGTSTDGEAVLALEADLPQGSTVYVDLSDAALALNVAQTFTLAAVASSAESGPGANAASFRLTGASVAGLQVVTLCV
ncbi:hypothetical protein ACOACO_01160 [Nocardioides sp. CPCC 205120]|uniref:hypothetical protein n=1 Tax=Nocardioides sp. CPCC 205120 TaxID=3406462 RepID=UPI003B5041AD